MSISRNAATLKQHYDEFTRWLKDQDAFLTGIEQSLHDNKYDELLERKIQIVSTAKGAVLDTLSRKGKVELPAKKREVDQAVKRLLLRNKAYTEATAQANEYQKDVNRLKASLKQAEKSPWFQPSEWVASVAHWFKGTKKQPKETKDYVVLISNALLQRQELLAKSLEVVNKIKDMVTTEVETDLLETNVKQARDSSDLVSELLTSDFRSFADALRDLRKKISPLKSALQAQLLTITRLSKDLHTLLESYESKLMHLTSQFEDIDASRVVQQGSEEFMQLMLTALSEAGLTNVDTPPSLADTKSRCRPLRGVQATHHHEKEDKRTEWTVEESAGADFEPMAHQKTVAIMSRPDYAANFLIYHLPGAGKTCSIDLCMQTMAQYYLKSPPEGGIVPCVLLLVQNKASIPGYLKEITHRHCIDSNLMRGLMLKKFKEDTPDTHEWSFVKSSADRSVVMHVVIHRMTVALQSVHDWNKVPKPASIKRWEIPRVGAVIVDEAHNMINATQMQSNNNNHAKVFLQQLLLRPDIKRIFSTGTPALDSDRFDDLARLLDALKMGPANEQYSATTDLVRRTPALHQPTVDRWFTQTDDGAFAWKQGAEELFKRRVSGYISYMSLENDFGVYPRFEVVYKGKTYAGGVEAVWKDGAITVVHSGLPTKKIMCIQVPTDKFRLGKERTNISESGQIGVHFQHYKHKPHPQKWHCMKAVIDTALDKKHFIFVHKRQTTPFKNFLTEYFVKAAKLKEFKLPAKTNRAAIEAFYAQPPCERYMLLDDELTAEYFIEFYNDPRNTEGRYIRFVFGTIAVKEGISLFSTHYVHLVEPPSTSTVFEQSIRRAARYCSMRELLEVKDWTVTVIAYVADGSPREAAQHATIMSRDTSPVSLAYESMKSAAVDCHLHSALTGVSCYNKASVHDRVSEYCLDPKTGASKLIVYNVVDNNMQITEQQCVASDCIPGGLLAYDLWDNSLRLLLIDHGYEAKPLTVNGLVQQFGRNAGLIEYGIWHEQFHTPRLTFSRTVPVEVLASWIRLNARGIGDSVLFLLENKRASADVSTVKLLDRKASAFLERVKLQMETNATLEKLLEGMRAMQRNDMSEKDEILSASLRLTALADKLKSHRV